MARVWIGGIVLAAVLICAGRSMAADEGPAVFYARPPATYNARLSPDGTRVALIASYQGKPVIYVHSLVEGGKDGRIVHTNDFIAYWLRWKDNDHLVAGLRKTVDRLFYDTPHSEYSLTRLISVEADGSHFRMIGEPDGGFFNRGDTVARMPKIHPQHQGQVLSMLPAVPGKVLQEVLDKFPRAGERRMGKALYTIDIATGEHELIETADGRVEQYVTDRDGVALIGTGYKETNVLIYGRSSPAEHWREILNFKANGEEVFEPLAAMPGNPRIFYVLSNLGPNKKAGLWSFDVATGQFVELIDDQADLLRTAQVEDGVLLSYLRKDESRVYPDPAWRADYLAVRKATKDAEVTIVDRTADGSRALVEVHKRHQPMVWWVLDRGGKSLNLWPAVEEYPDIPAEKVAPVKDVTYAARDGLPIPAFITLPVGYKEGPIPFVVLPHGGPYVCERPDFDFMSQFLASRGWGVLRPQFRGSTCSGPEFERKGFGEWGFAMQDDLTDGTRWLIEQKYADPSRICIVGGSYGGYAALEGVTKEPDLYRCAAAWAPVTDLDKLFSEFGPVFVGDITQERLGEDKVRLLAASPALHADHIKAPVLLMHGKQDYTVSFHYSEDMERALRGAGKPVEAIYLENSDHYMVEYNSRLAWLSALDRFLGKQLGTP